ncbi:hypothetical protein MVLG_00068 [Microbotryum lychnidis-dioicae p1A1 Lamole]|uniref:Splicing factor Cactin n=1 Tax=Microbotryum lychnidis-dioicae (strain p1A1 Lamole / MvSl-1064) TaxID=683840 RepID=U5GXZ3_USTV1|nr:hypothetical protein MVLG_00068 [Microbotryum lychnidis-dioicae p1A1 Lamole]|eukprot:KDE09662.1 hypothetical protein MVLG_00068 [Microbotryum lychnidis-dioicae p1A1 Lamole]
MAEADSRDRHRDRDSHRDAHRDREDGDRSHKHHSTSSTRRRSASPSSHDRDRNRERDSHRHSSSSKRSKHDEEDDRHRSSSHRDRGRDRDRDRDGRGDRDRDEDRDRGRHRQKSSSTPRESSAERAARKAERKARKAALEQDARQLVAETSFYSASDNPFHDANLGDKFVWGKKKEKEKKMGMTPEEAMKRDRERAIESKLEIERLNQRRAEREQEMLLREEEQMRAARMAESAQMSAWIDREDDFHLEQAKKRAEIRVRERRAKPIDFLALNLKWSQPPLQEGDEGFEEQEEDEGEGLDVDLEEPYTIFDNLILEDAEELHEDIKMYLSLEKSEQNLEFWRSLLIVSSSSLEALNEERAIGATAYAKQTQANASVKGEITRLLSGKSLDQLVTLQNQVQSKLSSGEPVDVEYWEGLLKELVVWKAKAKLRDMHEVVLANRLEQLRKKQRDEAARQAEEVKKALASGLNPDDEDEDQDMEDENDQVMHLSRPAGPEPWSEDLEPIQFDTVPSELRSCAVVDAAEERAAVQAARLKVVQTRFVTKTRAPNEVGGVQQSAQEAAIYQAAIGQGFGDEEELFTGEIEMNKQAYSWEDKYRPRKPRYFNKVMAGYEWNRYNQAHYDSDNPPPKVVIGYKFHIIYSDLVDKTKTPQWRIIKDKDNPEMATILFSAGPPYEDLAFRIVNKKMEHSSKRGFRSSFDRGVLQLHFTFRRNFYRK